MGRINFLDEGLGHESEARGRDGRVSVDSRAANPGYYNSRDKRQTYALPFIHLAAVAGEISVAWQNTSTRLTLVISSVGINAVENARIKAFFGDVTTLAGGAAITPTNLNHPPLNVAQSAARQGTSGSQVTGVTTEGQIDFANVLALGHEELRFQDRIRLAQNEAILLEYDAGTTGDFFGVIFGYFE